MAIVVSHRADDFDALARQALRQAPLADVIELRLDRIGDPGEERLGRLIAELGKPVIAAVPGREAFGDFAASDEERLAILRSAARAGARFVDVDWRLSLDLGEVEGKCHRIVSRHEDTTPADLAGLREEVLEVLYEGDLVKLVPRAESTADGLRMLNFVRQIGGGLIGFCSGAAGGFTRVLAPIYGSPFTYAAPADLPGEPAAAPTAPGQLAVNDLRGLYPAGGPSPETAILGVVGSRVHTSFSPHVHGMALRAARLDAVFLAFETDDFEGFLELATDENLRGLSITAPHKEAAHAAAHTSDANTTAAGACNTLVRDPRGWRAFNTDVSAIRHVLARGLEQRAARGDGPAGLDRARALVLGAGGAARAAATVVSQDGGQLICAARRPEHAQALATAFGGRAAAWDEIAALEYDVLIHATPVGSDGYTDGPADGLPVPADAIRPGALVLDAVYNPVRTPLCLAAVERGCTAIPGAEWFVRQAAAQYRLFTQSDPDEGLMRAAFEHALHAGSRL